MHIDEAPIGYVGWILVQSYDGTLDKFVIRGREFIDWELASHDGDLSTAYSRLYLSGRESLADYRMLLECIRTIDGWKLHPINHWYKNTELSLLP